MADIISIYRKSTRSIRSSTKVTGEGRWLTKAIRLSILTEVAPRQHWISAIVRALEDSSDRELGEGALPVYMRNTMASLGAFSVRRIVPSALKPYFRRGKTQRATKQRPAGRFARCPYEVFSQQR